MAGSADEVDASDSSAVDHASRPATLGAFLALPLDARPQPIRPRSTARGGSGAAAWRRSGTEKRSLRTSTTPTSFPRRSERANFTKPAGGHFGPTCALSSRRFGP